MHEYTNKVIRNSLTSYVDVGKFVDDSRVLLPKLTKQLDMYVDDAAATRNGRANRSALMSDIKNAQKAFLDLLPNADNNQSTLTDIHHEIVALFSDCVLRSNVFDLLKICHLEYETRFNNNVPPGFKDAKKPANKLGDFIIWREIVESAVKRDAPKIIYVSDDQKLDWVYFPPQLLQPDGRPAGRNNKNGLSYPLIDPRLEFELALALQREPNIMIISFDQLVVSLSRESSLNFKQLAEAVQLIMAQKAKKDKSVASDDAIEPSTLLDLVSELSDEMTSSEGSETSPVSLPPAEAEGPHVAAPVDAPLFSYPDEAFADARFIVPKSDIGDIINLLKSHTWNTQNIAMQSIGTNLLNTASSEEIFVLGRNILQAAVGSAFVADRFMENLNWQLSKYQQSTAQHLINGMLYEVYFNSNNEFRGANGKSYYLLDIANTLEELPYLHDCAHFIQSALAPFEEAVLFIPLVKQGRHHLTLSFSRLIGAPNEPSFYDAILESCAIDNEVISITVGRGQSMPFQHQLQPLGNHSSLTYIKQAVSLSRYLPFTDEFLAVTCTLDGEPVSEEEIGDFIVSPGLTI